VTFVPLGIDHRSVLARSAARRPRVPVTLMLAAILTSCAKGTPPPTSESVAMPSPPALSAFSDFQAMGLDELKALQVKLTFIGEQDEVVTTLAFTSPSNTLDLNQFILYRRAGINYGNDDSYVNTCQASTTELKATIQNLSTLPAVTGGGVAREKFLSFAMFNTVASGDKAFEAILNHGDTKTLFERLRLALRANQSCLNALTRQWREMGLGIGSLDSDDDGDGLPGADEMVFGTEPLKPDSDGDGRTDGAEVATGTDPLNPLSR